MLRNNQNGEGSGGQYPQNGDFRRLMASSGLTNAALGRKINAHQNTVSRWAAGHVEVPGSVLAYLRLYNTMKAAIGD